jgi:hypothetical protein
MELSLKDLKELLSPRVCLIETDYEIGKPYTIKTVLGWYKGILTKETKQTLTLEDCSWVAQTKRFSDYVLDDSQVEEEEPFAKETKFIIERTSIIGGFRMSSITRKLK